jgi:glutamate N-acetyltransferase / amino-acid N-acetyltransferase
MTIEWTEGGSVTSPEGFLAGATAAGIKTYGPEPRLDLAILCCEDLAVSAGVFTRSRVCGAPVELSRERLASGHAQAIVVNSGCSNVAMGQRGRADAERMSALAAAHCSIRPEHMLVASTGVIGRPLPMSAIEAGIGAIALERGGGADFARAIMTTDTVAKSRALRLVHGDRVYTFGGAAKGSGMVHPDMATVLCFLTTDAPVESAWLARTLREVADVSLNMIDVDMDTSTSDTMVVLAGGRAGGTPIGDGHPLALSVHEALRELAVALAKDLARDGEGARTLIEVQVEGARTLEDARVAARTISSSPLVKTMVTGRDANLGRVMMALGRSGAEVEVELTSVFIGESCAFSRGAPTDVPYQRLSAEMNGPDVQIRVDLGLGEGRATAWGCDLTEEYVRINADYTT